MKIRTATLNDLDALAAVEAECFPAAEAATKKDFENRLAYYADHFWLMFDENGKLIAFVDGMVTDQTDLTDEMYEKGELHNENGAWQMIFGVNTIPSCRKKGYAGELIKAAIEDARKQGRKGLVLTCKDKLIHYYAKFCKRGRFPVRSRKCSMVSNEADFLSQPRFFNPSVIPVHLFYLQSGTYGHKPLVPLLFCRL